MRPKAGHASLATNESTGVSALPLDQAAQKAVAARRAVDEIEDGMVLGLGTGSTAALVVAEIGRRVRDGLRVVGVPTSEATARQARELGIPVATLEDHPVLDLDIDGADEVDPEHNLIKGLGGALLREKIVAMAARRLVVVVDESKLVDRLGDRSPLPVEVVAFGWRRTAAAVADLGADPVLRAGPAGPVRTDGGNYILDCRFAAVALPLFGARLKAITGVVEHGLFTGMGPTVVVGAADGACRVLS
jgi:ribose 5-phosphate isomerase A